MKRILALLLALMLVLFGITSLAEDDDDFEEIDDDPYGAFDDISGYDETQYRDGDYRYQINDDGETVRTACYEGSDSDVVVPATLGGYPVTVIGEGTFQNAPGVDKITSVTLPEGLLVIGNSAFKMCRSLKKVVIPEGVVKIEYGCFGGCMILQEINFPESLVEIEDFAFAACMKLEEVVFGHNLKKIGSQAFRLCGELKRVVIAPEGVEVSEDAFDECHPDLAFEDLPPAE